MVKENLKRLYQDPDPYEANTDPRKTEIFVPSWISGEIDV